MPLWFKHAIDRGHLKYRVIVLIFLKVYYKYIDCKDDLISIYNQSILLYRCGNVGHYYVYKNAIQGTKHRYYE